jgi:hypothetical protein
MWQGYFYIVNHLTNTIKTNRMQVLVFKTDIAYKRIAGNMTKKIEKMPGVLRCTFDLLDRDKILRVETTSLVPSQIEQLVKAQGYFCRELEG